MSKYKKNQGRYKHADLLPIKQPKTATKKKVSRTLENRSTCIKLNLEAYMLHLGKFLQNLWRATLGSDLHKKDKAEILRLLIFAVTIIGVVAIFVLNHGGG